MILLTGANGFLGSQLLQQLSQQGASVKALYRSTVPAHLQNLPHVIWHQIDLLDVLAIEEAMQGITKVYHTAAVVSYEKKMREHMIKSNVSITENIVNACLDGNIEKLVHVSSIAALGMNEETNEVNEEEYFQTKQKATAYGMSKYLSEMEVWRGIGEGLNAVIINPGIILGPATNWSEGSAALMGIIAKEFKYYSEGITGWVDVRDVAALMQLLMNSALESERFIVTEGNYSYKEIFALMAENLQVNAPSKKVTPTQTGIFWRLEALRSWVTGKKPAITQESAYTAQKVAYYNNEKLLAALPSFSYRGIEETIADMAVAYKAAHHNAQ